MTAASSSSQSPSLPPSSSPAPIRYFDLLPPELVRQILHQIDSLPEHHQKERQAMLHSLCLTSKLLHELAQPLLLQHIHVSRNNRSQLLRRLLAANSDNSFAAIQSITVEGTPLFDDNSLDLFAQKATKLREVAICRTLDSPLSSFSGKTITTLSLATFTVPKKPLLLEFPELINLSIRFCRFRDDQTRLSAPKLKHLSLIGGASSSAPPLSSFLYRTFPTISSFTTSARQMSSLLPSLVTSPSPLILLHVYPTEKPISNLPILKNVYFSYYSGESESPSRADREVDSIESCMNFILHSEHSLEAVTVGVVSERGGGIEQLCPARRAAVAALDAACHEKGIKVYFEEPGGGQTFAELVPPWFIQKSEALQDLRRGE